MASRKPVFVMLHLIAPNSQDGNPRRLYGLYSVDYEGNTYLSNLWDEGYAGADAVPSEFIFLARGAAPVNISAGEYKKLKRVKRKV